MRARQAIGKLIERIVLAAPETYKLRLFPRLARDLEIPSVIQSGSNGLIEGELCDEGLFGDYLREHRWAAPVLSVFKDFFRTSVSGSYIDVGASIGMTLIPIALMPEIDCIGIEASPKHFGLLQRNLLRNGLLDRVSLYNNAAFDREQILQMEVSEINQGRNLILPDGRIGTPVRAVRLDDLLDVDRLRRPIAIKMDIEGSETYAFLGGCKLLASSELVVMEFCAEAVEATGARPHDLFALIGKTFRKGGFVEADSRALRLIEIKPFLAEIEKRSHAAPSETWELLLSNSSAASETLS